MRFFAAINDYSKEETGAWKHQFDLQSWFLNQTSAGHLSFLVASIALQACHYKNYSPSNIDSLKV